MTSPDGTHPESDPRAVQGAGQQQSQQSQQTQLGQASQPSRAAQPADAAPDGVIAPDFSGFTPEMLASGQHHHGTRRRMSAAHIARIKRRKRRRRILLGVLALLLALLAYVAYLGYSAMQARAAIAQAVQGAQGVSAAMSSGDAKAAQAAVAQLQQGVDAAYRQTSQPAWAVPTVLPVIGSDVQAVRGAVSIMHTVSSEALPDLSAAAGNLSANAISVKDGTVSMPALSKSADGLAHASTVLNDATVELGNLPTPHVEQLRTALDAATGKFDEIAGLVDTYARIAQVVPPMLDLDGQGARTYLVIAQNNSEVRPTGGLPASWGTVTVQNGKLTLGDFTSESSLPLLSQSVLDETDEEKGLFGSNLTTKPHDVNFTPDYPRAAQIAQAMWSNARQQQVDGVIMMDPVLLQNLLAVTGGMTASNGVKLDGTNTAQYLLHDTYFAKLTPTAQDQLFATVAHDAFSHVLAQAGANSTTLVKSVMDSASQGHLLVWLSRASEQQHLSGTAIAGELETKPASPTAGVYFSDGTQGKMDWYLDRSVSASKTQELSSGAAQYALHVTMRNSLAASDVASLPAYVTGEGMSAQTEGVQPGDIWTMVYIYAPADGRLVDWKLSDGSSFDTISVHKGLTVGAKRVVLKPGESFDFTVTVETSARAAGEQLAIRQTPLIRDERRD